MHKLDEKALAADVVAAWESLPGGNYSPDRVARWLLQDMKPVIDKCRAYLASLPSPEQSAAQQPATEAVEVPDMFWPDDAEDCFENVGDYADQSGEREVVCKVRCAKSLPSRWAYAEYIEGEGWITSFFDTEAEALAAPSHAALSQSPSKPAGGSTDENH